MSPDSTHPKQRLARAAMGLTEYLLGKTCLLAAGCLPAACLLEWVGIPSLPLPVGHCWLLSMPADSVVAYRQIHLGEMPS